MEHPPVRTIGWVDASGVVGHEDRGFSKRLGDNLDLLGDALVLPPLTLVERDAGAGSYRVDILVVTDDGMPVVVENQYGGRNHDHLGTHATYLVKQRRGLGVWIVERFTEPHLAAVEFLNRTSNETVGHALVMKFAPAPGGEHHVVLQYGLRAGRVQQLPATAGHVPASSQAAAVTANGQTPIGSHRGATTDAHAKSSAARRPPGRRPPSLPAQELP